MQEQNPRQSSGQPFSECSSSCLCICLPGCLSVAGILYKYFTCVLQKLQGVTLILLFHMCMPTGADTDFFLPAASSRSEIAERHIPEDRTPELELGCKTQTASGILQRELPCGHARTEPVRSTYLKNMKGDPLQKTQEHQNQNKNKRVTVREALRS